MKNVMVIGAIALWGVVYGAPEVVQQSNCVVLTNAGAEYRFDRSNLYRLSNMTYRDRPCWPKKFGLTYNMPGDRWFWEEKHEPEFVTGPTKIKITRSSNKVTLTTTATGKKLTIMRQYTLQGNSPDLEYRMKMSVKGENQIAWLNLLTTSIPADQHWLRLLSSVGSKGVIETKLHSTTVNPFVDKNGKYRVVDNYETRVISGFPLVGSYDAQKDIGTLLVMLPEKSMLTFQMYYNNKTHRASASITTSRFNLEADGTQSLDAVFKIVPFTGRPENFPAAKFAQLVEPLKKADVVPVSYMPGAQLPASQGFKFFRELADNRVYRHAPIPARRENGVKIYAARDEGESFQLVIRAPRAVKSLKLQSAGLFKGKSKLPLQINAIGYHQITESYAANCILGDNPDVLLDTAQVATKGGENTPFLVAVKVPKQAAPGWYRGQVEVVADGKTVGRVPVALQVWNFSLEKSHLTAALDVWWRYKNYPQAKQSQVAKAALKMLQEARAGNRWIYGAHARWDEAGNLISVDYREFDRCAEAALHQSRHRVLIPRFFVIGYAHRLQNNYFGKKAEILTPKWQRKMLSFAKNFRQHLIEKKWNDLVVIDLFDEPTEQCHHAIIETVKLLRTVAPEWRFTLAGNYAPQLKHVINYWNMSMGDAGKLQCQVIRKAGGEPTVYNPGGYTEYSRLGRTRGNYLWLFNEKISYIYQWVVNCWAEEGYSGWDQYRCASWILPGPNGPLSTLRLEATRNGIEDYEYLVRLESGVKQLANRQPELAQRAQKLLDQVKREVKRTRNDEQVVYATPDPSFYDNFHREAGAVLHAMTRFQKN